jgi:hypothetical protein
MRFGPQHAHAAASLLRSVDLLDAELRDLQERVTEHLAAIPASWRVDSGGQSVGRRRPAARPLRESSRVARDAPQPEATAR